MPATRPGTYRAEVWAPAIGRPGYVPWIVGNPIVVGPVEALPVAPRPDMSGARRSGSRRPARCGESSTVRARRPGSIGTDGISLAYTLAPEGMPAPYAALLATTTIDRGATGVAFVGRADRPMRVSVQVRVPAAGEGLRWHRSVYLDERPREIVIPFAEMTPLGDTPKGPPRVGDVRTLLFVVDLVNAKAGASGRFSVADVRFFAPGSWTASAR